MAHRTNLAIQTFSNVPLLFHIENLLQCLYGYFNHNPKRHLKFTKLVEIMETKSNKILWNIKIKWISMISLVKCVLSKYHTLLIKMALDAPTTPSIKSNLFLLIDVETMFNLIVMMPMLKAVHSLIKFTQLKDVFFYNFITTIKIGERDVYRMFYDRLF
jgi:hypothetical protein